VPYTAVVPRLFVDLRPLRESRDFRLLYFGQFISLLGSNLTVVAIPFQVYRLTHASLWVGLTALIQFPFLVGGSFISGPIGDRHDRRTLVIYGSLAAGIVSVALGCNSIAHRPALWLLMVLAGFASFTTGFTNPQRNSMIPRILHDDLLVQGYALFQLIFNTGLVLGPSLAGLLLAHVSVSSCYFLDAITFGALIIGTLGVTPQPPLTPARDEGLFTAMQAGFHYVRHHKLVQAVYLVDMNAMIFGLPSALYPAVAFEIYHGGPSTLGLLYAAPGIGAIVMALTTGWIAKVDRQGRLVVLVVVGWGLAMTVFGLVPLLWAGILSLAVAGAMDVISTILRNAILQNNISDEFRSRITSIQFAVVQGGPRLGSFESGVVAALSSTEFSIVSGGIACVAGVVALLKWRPELWRQEKLTN
jgi:MFS family permease